MQADGIDLAAALGAAWAIVQMALHRRNRARLRAWGEGALGMSLLLLEHHQHHLGAGSALLWLAAMYLCHACARRHAMRRYVMPVVRAGIVLGVLAIGLAGFANDGAAAGPATALQALRASCEFLAVLLFALALLLARISPVKAYRFAPAELGRRARSLQYDFGLALRRRYSRFHPLLRIPGTPYLVNLVLILWFVPQVARAAARDGGRSVPLQVVDLLRLGFTQGINAKAYYVHDLYRAPGLVNETITRSESKNGLTRALQRLATAPTLPMSDKLAFWRVCEERGIASAAILASLRRGVLTLTAGREALDCDLFVKDRSGRGGHGTMNLERVAPFSYRDDEGAVLGLDAVFDRLRAASAARSLIVQPKLANHPSIASLANKSLIAFRVVSCLDRHGEPQVTHGILRVLRRFEPDWPAGPDDDWGCAIDLETGALGMMTGDAPATCTKWFADHPVTGERVAGRRLEGWPQIAAAARDAHRVFANLILIGWDIGWTPQGVRILEGNVSLDFSFFQRVYRTPVGRSPLAPLLNMHFDALTDRLVREARAD